MEIAGPSITKQRTIMRNSISPEEKLVEIVEPSITKQRTITRNSISPEEKWAVTLRFLATGESFENLMFQFKIHKSTSSQFIPRVCEAIYNNLKDKYLKLPQTTQKWINCDSEISQRWQFPNCIGAADGKHISMFHPKDSGSDYYNYKGFFSVVLLALVDYDYKFTFVDVGCQGRITDGGVFRNSYLCKALDNGSLNLPDPKPLSFSHSPEWAHEQCTEPIPFVFVGDDAFPLSDHCMKPYPRTNLTLRKRVYNYRLSRFRRCSENAFGIWVNRFRVFTAKIHLSPEKATAITLASLLLHNMLR